MNIILKTERLILRKPKLSDWKDVVEGVGEYGVSKWLTTVPYPYKKSDAFKWISKYIKKWGDKDYPFFIELRSEKKVIGCIAIHHVDKFTKVGATGSWINKKYWKKGYITEAKIAINDFAFNKLKLERLNSSIFSNNKASNATQKKMGYKFEGKRRRCVGSKASGKIYDENMYGLLKDDWKKARRKLVK
ncbi:GNAT family N-acetyltransferase [Patescibacteria group bacterium]|nr:GNAT family N-acetyltransferase [Patescibacteria group bacterium]